jgi:hypothetical protein
MDVDEARTLSPLCAAIAVWVTVFVMNIATILL